MSIKQKLISTATSFVAVAAFATFAAAQDTTAPQSSDSVAPQPKTERGYGNREGFGRGKFGKEGRGGKHGDEMMMGALRQLNLTDTQKTQIKSVMDSNRAANQGTHEEVRGLMMKQRDGSITADEQSKLKEYRAQGKADAEKTHSAILAILTPEQRTQLDQMKEQMKEKRQQKMEERRQMNQTKQAPSAPNQNN